MTLPRKELEAGVEAEGQAPHPAAAVGDHQLGRADPLGRGDGEDEASPALSKGDHRPGQGLRRRQPAPGRVEDEEALALAGSALVLDGQESVGGERGEGAHRLCRRQGQARRRPQPCTVTSKSSPRSETTAGPLGGHRACGRGRSSRPEPTSTESRPGGQRSLGPRRGGGAGKGPERDRVEGSEGERARGANQARRGAGAALGAVARAATATAAATFPVMGRS